VGEDEIGVDKAPLRLRPDEAGRTREEGEGSWGIRPLEHALRPTRYVPSLGRTLGLRTVDCSLTELIGHAIAFDWTRDPFDRLLAAHATAEQAPFLTADRRIRDHLPLAVWDG